MNLRIFVIVLNVFMFLCSVNSHSEEIKLDEKSKKFSPMEFSPIKMFFILEGLAGVNSWMASENPQIYGGVAALLFPLAVWFYPDLTDTSLRVIIHSEVNDAQTQEIQSRIQTGSSPTGWAI